MALLPLDRAVLGGIGDHEAGRDHIDAHIGRTALLGQTLGHGQHRTLGGDVVQVARLASDGHHRGDVDDGTAVLRTHGGHHGLAAVPHPLHVDAEDALPDGGVDFLEGGELDFTEVGGVVDQAVDAAKALEGCSGHGIHRSLIGHVDAHRNRLTTSRFNELHGFIGIVHVGHHHVGALGGRLHGKGLADAGGAAGDDDRALVKQMVLVHGTSFGK
jgi:hypothetical protein